MSARPQILSAAQAAERIPAGAGIIAPGNNFRLAPESLLAAIEALYRETRSPRDLVLYYPMMIEAARGHEGVPGTGFNRLAHPGLLRRVVGGSFSRVPAHELNTAIRDDQIEAYNLPIGTLVALLRAAARGDKGVLTPTGLDTFVDPRRGGGRLNQRTTDNLAQVVQFGGDEYLWYPTPAIDVALIRASLADERGNISFEREAFTLGSLHAAIAARNRGGQVLVEVDDIVDAGTLDPRKVVIPGHMVSAVIRADVSAMPTDGSGRGTGLANIVATHSTNPVASTALPEWSFSGERRAPERHVSLTVNPRTIIARRALRCVPYGGVVNLGAGLPMYDISKVALWEGAAPETYRFSIEQGAFGGWPEAGGVAANPDAILDVGPVFDYYTGGGIDVSILSFAEVDGDGSVNVSRFGKMMPGCGGFIDITQNAKALVFCGAFAAGAEVALDADSGRLEVRSAGKASKFVRELQQLTFNAKSSRNRACSITYVTERAVFVRAGDRLKLVEVAPGIDVRRDVLDLLPFDVHVADNLAQMDEALFHPPRLPGNANTSRVHAVR